MLVWSHDDLQYLKVNFTEQLSLYAPVSRNQHQQWRAFPRLFGL